PFVNYGMVRINTYGYTGTNTFTFASLDNAGVVTLVQQRNLPNFHVVSITGDFVQRVTGTLHTEVAYGYFGEAESGWLFVNGRATLAGAMEVKYVRNIYGNDPAAPRAGDVWAIVTAGTMTGSFTKLVDMDPEDGVKFDQLVTETTLEVAAS